MNIINHQHYPIGINNNPSRKPNSLVDLIKNNFNAASSSSSFTNSQQITEDTWLHKLIDSSHLITFCISISVIIYGSFRSLNIDVSKAASISDESIDNKNEQDSENEQQNFQQSIQTIDSTQALIIPVAASVSLLLMFFFFDSIQTAFLICTSILAIVTFAFLLQPVSLILFKSVCKTSCYQKKKVSCCFLGKFTPPELLSIFFASCLVCAWIVTGHWLLMDIIGIGFCITFIAIVRLPSLKVSTVLLVGLVVYDVFWVYFSHLIFSSNVMVKVATKEADNPMSYMARKLNMETQFSRDSPKLSLPGKLLVPSYQKNGNFQAFSILGLGDIVVPGLLLCFVLRFDAYKRSQLINKMTLTTESDMAHLKQPNKCINKFVCECIDCKSKSNLKRGFKNSTYSIRNLMRLNRITYFHCSLIGYFVGLITATLSSEIFKEAQPALLYLVPFTLLPLLIMAYLKGDLKLMWNEPFSYATTPSYFHI